MTAFFIVSLFLNLLLGFLFYQNGILLSACFKELLDQDDTIANLKEQIEVQQDAIQAAHGNFYDPKGVPVTTPGPWHSQEDAFQLPFPNMGLYDPSQSPRS